MFDLKPLSKDAIPAALEKAMRYRLLNEPAEAESICMDVLAAQPDHQPALTTLLLAITDRFDRGYAAGVAKAQEILTQLRDPYERAYYAGIIGERRAKAFLKQNTPGAEFDACELFREAMSWFEKAERLRPPGNDDALLRWNACARLIMANKLEPRPAGSRELPLE